MPVLRRLKMANNLLTGIIPAEVGKFVAGLNGTIAKELVLHLENNLLTGSIPEVMYSLTKLQQLGLGGNNVSIQHHHSC